LRVQEFRSSGVQEFRSSGVQEFRNDEEEVSFVDVFMVKIWQSLYDPECL